MSPATVELLVQLGITLAKPIEELITGWFEKDPAAEEAAQLHLIRALGDKRAAEKFGPLPQSNV